MWACRVHDRARNPDRSWSQARQDTKTGEPHSAVPNFLVYTTISLTAHSMKEQHAYTYTHMHDSACIHLYTHTRIHDSASYLHTCIQTYMHPSSILYSPLVSTVPMALADCTQLTQLDLRYMQSLCNISGLRSCALLESIFFVDLPKLEDINPLSGCKSLMYTFNTATTLLISLRCQIAKT